MLGTKPNAFITSLLEEYLRANPGRQKSDEEKAQIAKVYKPSEQILLPVSRRRPSDQHRRLAEELEELRLVTDQALAEADRRHARAQRDRSRDRRDDGRAPRRRHEADRNRAANEAPSVRHEPPRDMPLQPRSIEHQSSLRSLLSASDFEVSDIEEEIARQIIEEGLLDGIDLSEIGVEEENAIRERIDEAYRRRQRSRMGPSRRGSEGDRPTRQTRDAGRRHRTHSRSHSASMQGRPARNAPATTHMDAAGAGAAAGRTERRRRRSIHTPRAESPVRRAVNQDEAADVRRTAARSATDLSHAPRSPQGPPLPRSSNRGGSGRSITDPDIETTDQRRRASEQVRTASGRSDAESAPQRSPEIVDGALASEETRMATATAAQPRTPDQVPRSRNESSRIPRTRTEVASEPTSRPSSFGPAAPGPGRTRTLLYPEPSISCNRCGRAGIQYELHYNCAQCDGGDYNLCLSCYRQGRGCKHWYGFGWAAWQNYERQTPAGGYPPNHPLPHTLTGHRFLHPAAQNLVPGPTTTATSSSSTATSSTSDSKRRSLTAEDPLKRLQAGVFCSMCSGFANACFWKCDACNDGEWGFCHRCLSTGRCCTHPLLPLVYVSPTKDAPSQPDNTAAASSTAPTCSSSSAPSSLQAPNNMTVLRGPEAVEHGPLKPVSIATSCNVCRLPIQPSSTRYHCLRCNDGDYDICTSCYLKLCGSGKISGENGNKGWRRCLRGHRMIVVGFEDQDGGKKRVVVRDLVGGLALKDEADPSFSSSSSSSGGGVEGNTTTTTTGSRSTATHGNGAAQTKLGGNWSWREGPDGRVESKSISQASPSLRSNTIANTSLNSSTNSSPNTNPSTTNPSTTATTTTTTNNNHNVPTHFPPDGGIGMRVLARWGYFPGPDVKDELMFPRAAEIREVEDINGDWYWGCYAGHKGLFPGPYVVVVDVVGRGRG